MNFTRYYSSVLLLFLFSLLFSSQAIAQSAATPNTTGKVNKRVASLIKVRPEFEERYIILHRNTFPGVLASIKRSNIRNYSIFLLNGMLFSQFEYIGKDFDGDMKAIGDPVTRDWWKLTDPMQEPLSTRKQGEWWAEMETLLHLQFDDVQYPDQTAKRIALTGTIKTDAESKLRILLTTLSVKVKNIFRNNRMQNINVYTKDGAIYLYCEYYCDNYSFDASRMYANSDYKSFYDGVADLLVKDGANQVFHPMTEVFHTN